MPLERSIRAERDRTASINAAAERAGGAQTRASRSATLFSLNLQLARPCLEALVSRAAAFARPRSSITRSNGKRRSAVPADDVFNCPAKEKPLSKLALTLACGECEIVRALMDGTRQSLMVSTSMCSRQWIRARGIGASCAIASSTWPRCRAPRIWSARSGRSHRRHSRLPAPQVRHGFIFINTAQGIRTPADLVGRKIGVKQFQNTAIVWLRASSSMNTACRCSLDRTGLRT